MILSDAASMNSLEETVRTRNQSKRTEESRYNVVFLLMVRTATRKVSSYGVLVSASLAFNQRH